ncbi:MAG: anthranilate synthase [Gammaproteobacteria bacterium]|jgi:anthranilate synthase
MNNQQTREYTTASGIRVRHEQRLETYENASDPLCASLDDHRGVLLASSFEYPGRYTRWDIGFVNPPLEFVARGRDVTLRALNERGKVLLAPIARALEDLEALQSIESSATDIVARVRESNEEFPEELRSKQPTVFSVLRRIIELFADSKEKYLGFYGAFGYELAFQFETTRLKMHREASDRDLVLYLPDEILIVDHRKQEAISHLYEFSHQLDGDDTSTLDLPRDGERIPYVPANSVEQACDHAAGEYAAVVREAIECFRRGDLFEVVPGQMFFEPCVSTPADLFTRLKQRNPAPYGALMNLGEREYLVAASPEMYVRVDGRRIETCPISGTIKRGADAIGDAKQILELLNSEKETSELTMCTDVDRNDKSRVCEAGSIKVIGRRQIEMYSRLIHTVDHVEGMLREGYDALDGFLAHTWAVTVTGAPKQHAIQFIEDHERSPRRWYGGAMGFVGFDGSMNTGLTLRTVRIKHGIAEVRAGATLLFDSNPDAEEQETRLKASALLDAIRNPDRPKSITSNDHEHRPGAGKRVLMVDHEDSFVHTLAGYFRETGAEVITYRAGFALSRLVDEQPDLVLLSPGPGRPQDFGVPATVAAAIAANLPVFGVCLGLQGIIEHFGGRLDMLATPMHGKSSVVQATGGRLFKGLPEQFEAGRYHSLFATPESLPAELRICARTVDHVVMAVEHNELPVAGVQFHPESILSLGDEFGIRLIRNVMSELSK